MLSVNKSKCFLIADEVGLGKTRTASHIVWELSKQTNNPCTVLYLASNQRISAQNIEEFTGKPLHTKLAGYQHSTMLRACRAFLGQSWEPSQNQARQFQRMQCDRIITLWQETHRPWYAANSQGAISRAYAFSPKLSFFTDDGDFYLGSEAERALIRKLATEELPLSQEERQAICRSREYFEQQLSKPLNLRSLCSQMENKVGNSEFRILRGIFSNAALYLLRPNVLVLDEFQRFTDVLKPVSAQKYSIHTYIKFLEFVKEETPYILLLSATPYNYNHREEGVNPFRDFKTLQKAMEALGANTSEPKYYLSRAERRIFFQEEDRKLYQTVSEPLDSAGNSKYLLYLSEFYRHSTAVHQTYLSETPNYWLFAHGYGAKDQSEAGTDKVSSKMDLMSPYREMCQNPQLSKLNPYHHGRLQLLMRESHWEDLRRRLWLEPSLCAAQDHSPLGKRLVFTHYHMSARSAAYYLDKQVQDTLNTKPLGQLAGLEEALLSFVPKHAKETARGEKIAQILSVFLQKDYPRRVIFDVEKRWSVDAVVDYCRRYQLSEVLEEYDQLLMQQGICLDERLSEILGLSHLGKVKVGLDGEHELQFSVRYTDDPDQNVGHNKEFEQAILHRFNSPFYPFVLIATDTAQEGLNMHDYADSIMHWSPASSVSAFQQREGRIDRPNSRTIRCRLSYLYHLTAQDQTQTPTFQNLTETAYEMVLQVQNSREQLQLAKKAGIFPYWYLPAIPNAEPFPHIHRILCQTLFSGEEETNQQLLQGAKEYHRLAPELNAADKCAFLCEESQGKECPNG